MLAPKALAIIDEFAESYKSGIVTGKNPQFTANVGNLSCLTQQYPEAPAGASKTR